MLLAPYENSEMFGNDDYNTHNSLLINLGYQCTVYMYNHLLNCILIIIQLSIADPVAFANNC